MEDQTPLIADEILEQKGRQYIFWMFADLLNGTKQIPDPMLKTFLQICHFCKRIWARFRESTACPIIRFDFILNSPLPFQT